MPSQRNLKKCRKKRLPLLKNENVIISVRRCPN